MANMLWTHVLDTCGGHDTSILRVFLFLKIPSVGVSYHPHVYMLVSVHHISNISTAEWYANNQPYGTRFTSSSVFKVMSLLL